MPVFHSQLESDALGGETEWAEKDNWPSPSRFTIEEPDQVKVPDDFVRAARRWRPSTGRHQAAAPALSRTSPSSARSTGPWSVGYQMVGIESFLMDVMLDPDKIKRYLDAFAAGVHRVRAGAVRGRCGRRDVGRPHHRRPVPRRDLSRLPARDAPAHHPGDGRARACSIAAARPSTGSHLFAAAGWDVFHFESQVDAREARADGRRADGAVRQPQQPDACSTRARPRTSTRRAGTCMDAGVDGLAPEGSVPLITKKEPLKAIAQAARDWSAVHRGDGRHRRPARPVDQLVRRLSRHGRRVATRAQESTEHGGSEATPDWRSRSATARPRSRSPSRRSTRRSLRRPCSTP